MPNYVITYNISADDTRKGFEEVLVSLGLDKEDSNQSTYFGFSGSLYTNFITQLFNEIKAFEWDKEDSVTIYYPKATDKKADIGFYELKTKGKNILNP